MRRPVSERDAVGSQVIDALEAQKIKETVVERARLFCLTILASGVLCCSPSRSYLLKLKGIASTGSPRSGKFASIKEARMWREGKLARLREELEMLDLFDRVHDCGTDHRNRLDNVAYVSRQKRRAKILAETAKLEVRKPWFEGLGAGTLALLVCAILYATFRYLFK